MDPVVLVIRFSLTGIICGVWAILSLLAMYWLCMVWG